MKEEKATRPNMLPPAFAFVLAIVLWSLVSHAAGAAQAWQSTLSKEPPGTFPPLRSLHANYAFGWAGITAATADVHFSRSPQDHYQLQGTGRTSGFVRALWRYDVNYRALTVATTLRPIEANQVEIVRSKKMATNLAFTTTGVTRSRTEGPGAGTTYTREFDFPDLFDLLSGMLYLRSQPLTNHSVERLVVYPSTNAYLAIVTVTGREKTSVRAGSFNAIKLDLQLKRIGKDFDLQPYRKFHKATIWVSDDPDRVILRIEAQIFVGSIFAELQSLRLEEAQPSSPARSPKTS